MRTNDEIIECMDSLRREKNISISELSRIVGMSKSGVSLYFNKTRKFPLDRAEEFAKALGTTAEKILDVKPKTELNSKIDLRTIASSAMAFDGHQLNDEDLDLITSVLEARMKNRDKE